MPARTDVPNRHEVNIPVGYATPERRLVVPVGWSGTLTDTQSIFLWLEMRQITRFVGLTSLLDRCLNHFHLMRLIEITPKT